MISLLALDFTDYSLMFLAACLLMIIGGAVYDMLAKGDKPAKAPRAKKPKEKKAKKEKKPKKKKEKKKKGKKGKDEEASEEPDADEDAPNEE